MADLSSGMCRYFGAAKQLPGVKELFEKDAPRQVRHLTALLLIVHAPYCRVAGSRQLYINILGDLIPILGDPCHQGSSNE